MTTPPEPLETHDEVTPLDPEISDALMALAGLATDDENDLASVHTIVKGLERGWARERQKREERELQIQSDYHGLVRAQTTAVSGFTDGMIELTAKIASLADSVKDLTKKIDVQTAALESAGIIGGKYSHVAPQDDGV